MNSCWRTFVAIALIWASEVFLVHADGNSTAEESTTPKVTTSLPPKDEDLLGDTYQPTQNYCDPSLCENKVHVACERHKSRKLITEYYSKACPRAARWLALEDDTKTLILDTINGMRDKVAHGGFDAFLPAIRMASVQWDDELAYIAKHNVLKCRLHRDHCRNTARYKNVGQTVAFREVRPGRGDTTDKAIVRMIQLWFKEHEVATMADMEAYKGRHGRPRENFYQLMMENSHKVGCATLLQMKNGWMKWFLCCNYAHGATLGKPIYKSSFKSGIGCQTGKHPEYENLCSPEEPYDEQTASTNSTTSPNSAVVKSRTNNPSPEEATAETANPDDRVVTTGYQNDTQSLAGPNNLSGNKRDININFNFFCFLEKTLVSQGATN
ncbi:tabinhibitin 6 isoform X1 [Drosophila sulfurigaster albostrigata]|uniref:tabinhibitin 6 isoform X1 n=1 Tax=Drosophila sulfurigaster albostrigata TaxID=89887 RepID=UPI002D21C94D|nr:tabinhibitin 6 isoform X1 [Drosophila sulfurigaster albostrigata]